MALTKILNDESKSYKPVLTDKLVYDTKPTVNSFNGITSDAVARAIAGASGEVPAVEEGDNGKVLTAVYDEGGAAVEWADAASGVPAATESDEGKVLGVTNNQGSVGWVAQTPAQVNSDWNAASGAAQILNKPSLAAVATSGSYSDLTDKPTIPAAQVNSDWNAASGVSQILNKPSLATVATSGSYADLNNKPTIPTVDQSYSASSTNAQSGTAVAQAIAAIPSSSYTAGDGIDITANEVSVRAGRNLGFESQSTTVTLQSPTFSSGGSKYAFLGKLDADTVAALKSGTVSLTPKYDYNISLAGVIDSGARFAICQSSAYNQPLSNGKWVISNNVISGSGITYFTLTADTAYTVDFSSLSSKSTGTWTDVEANPTNFYLVLAAYSSQYSIADVQSFGQTSAISYAQNPGDVSTITIGDPNALYLYAEDQLPSISGNSGKVLTVNSGATGIEWATPSGGSSYTFSAPLSESSGTVVLAVDTDELNIAQKTTTLSAQREISAAESGYAWYLGTLTQDTSDTVYTFTFNNVTVSNAVAVAVNAQGKHIYPLIIGETYGSWGNQWIIPTALTFNAGNNTVSGSFDVCFKSGESDYPTHLDSYGQLSWASVLVLVVADNVPSAQVSSSSIYGSTTDVSTVSYSTGDSMLMVKHPVPAVTSSDNGKVLKATYSNGSGSFGWDTAPTELPASLGTAGQVLTVNSGATGVEWATPSGGNVTDYVATYISSTNKPSNDWCSGLATAMDNGQRIGLFVKMKAFSGSYASGVVNPYDNNAKIYLPLASAIDKSEPDQYTTFVYEYNFFLYDGTNKLKITLTETWQNDSSTYVWSTPTISQ